MINDLIKQIIALDQQTQKEVEDIATEVKTIQENTAVDIRERESTEIEQTRANCQAQYDKSIAEAEKLKENYISEAEQQCINIRNIYNSIKDEEAVKIVESLLSQEV